MLASGSAVSRLFWHPEPPGTCQAGTKLLPKGLFIHSEISWLIAVTLATLVPRIPGSIQLAQIKVWTNFTWVSSPTSNEVWKPITQQRLTSFFGASTTFG